MKAIVSVFQRISRWPKERSQPGQGLVEYATILSFVAVFVVAALTHLQSAVSTSLNSTGNAVTNGSASALWTPCGGICSFSGPMTVATGSAGSYTYTTATDGASCASGETCYFAPLPPASPWTFGSEEHWPGPGYFNFSGTMVVAFGANGQYDYDTFTGGADCALTGFPPDPSAGFSPDPLHGVHKACYLLPPPD